MTDCEHKPHTHLTENGILVKCYHHCRTIIAQKGFWIGVTVSYPFEHLLWEKVWPFKVIAHWLGVF